MEAKSKQRRSDCSHKYRLISSGRKDTRIYTNQREARMMLKVEKQMGFTAYIEPIANAEEIEARRQQEGK